MNAVQYRFIKLLAEFDDSGGWQGETGMIVINARLPPEEGALVVRALVQMAESYLITLELLYVAPAKNRLMNSTRIICS